MTDKKQNLKQLNLFPKMEEQILDFWEKNKIFEKSVEAPAGGSPRGDYVFYDGPPFGTGEPHYGHLLSSISKDVIPRFWTMRGFRVERRWGWDCHGLPIENIIEQDLKISGKKEIEKIGIAKFNKACRVRVLEYADTWDKMIRRIGRWVEFKNSYKTMDLSFMESVWWAFKELWQKNLIYEGRKVLLYCPRCETPISNFEVAMDNSYKDITEKSVTVKFKVKNAKEKLGIGGDVYILAWTTTPWTLPGNVALAVGKDIEYVAITSQKEVTQGGPKIKIGDTYIFAVNILPRQHDSLFYRDNITAPEVQTDLLEGDAKKIAKKYGSKIIKGKDLVGLEYEPLFDVPAIINSAKKAYYVAAADFVTTDEGTGIVHTAVVYGEDDYNLGLKLDLPVVPALDNKGHFNETVPQFKGVYFLKANKLVIEDLEKRGLLFKAEDFTHSYPHCHRCETQLFYNAIPAWFLNIGKLRKRMLELNKNINWYPEHLKEGRFAKGIEQAPDWNISRNRFFATPMPIWRCEKCGRIDVIGSVDELKEKSGEKNISDIHNHKIDHLVWKCPKCKNIMKRISEVFDSWVESGSMPFAQMHYPFENKEKFENNFPAQFITEYISQTRAWFYVMHVLSTALFDSNSYENVVTTGVILNEKGEKMSKSKKNYPDPWKVVNEYGADALRLYLMSSPLMQAENLFFNERDLQDVFRKNIMILWNVYKFYEMYETEIENEQLDLKTGVCAMPICENILDKWLIAKLNVLTKEVTDKMKGYNLPKATRPISDFINDFSTWYLRRSRARFKSDNKTDRTMVIKTTRYVFLVLAKIIAPVMPFMAEQLWQKVSGLNFKDENRSVHLSAWAEYIDPAEDDSLKLLTEMETVRKIVELGLAKRDKAGIKVRQALNQLKIINYELRIEYEELIKDELNVKNVVARKGKGELSVELDTIITDDLKLDGLKREIVRLVNAMRKNLGLTIKDRIILNWQSDSELAKKVFGQMADELKRDTLSAEIAVGQIKGKTIKVNGEEVKLEIKKASMKGNPEED